MTIYLYFAKRFLFRFLGVFGAFFAIALLTDATGLFGRFDEADVSMWGTLRLALLKAPSGVYALMSMIVILTSLMMFLGLSRNSELVATRASGQSAFRSLVAPMTMAFALGVIGVAAFSPMSAIALRQFETETGRYDSGSISAFSLSREGLWLRQGNDAGQTVIFAQRANFDATRLSGVTFFEFSPEGIVLRRIEASSARLSDGAWNLGSGKFWEVNHRAVVPDRAATAFETLILPSDLTSDQILESFGDPATVPIWEMRAFIDRLERSGFATNRYHVHLQMELALPFLLAAMVMVGAAFSMRHQRSGGVGIMVLLTVLMGLGFFIFQDFARILGSNGAIPVIAAAWGPPISAFLLAFGLILNMEDG